MFFCYFVYSGEPFYRDTSKLSSLIILIITSCILSYKEMYYLASMTLMTASTLIILFAKNIF